jgi:hypothetical protein
MFSFLTCHTYALIIRGEAVVLYVRDNKDVERDNGLINREFVRGLSKMQRIKQRHENQRFLRGVPIDSIENIDMFFNSLGVPLYDAENVLTKGQSFG